MPDTPPMTGLPQLLILGAGGHAGVVIELVRLASAATIVGLADADPARRGTLLHGCEIIGGDEVLADARGRGISAAHVAVGSAGPTAARARLAEMARRHGVPLLTLVHPQAWVSPTATLGAGTCVCARAVVQAGARVGSNVIVNTAAVVEHDAVVGDDSHIATAAALLGNVRVGRGVHVGGGAVIRQGLSIGDGAVVGAGAVVTRDVPPGETWVGVPARRLAR